MTADDSGEGDGIIERHESFLLWAVPIFATVYWYETGTFGFEKSAFVMLAIIAILVAFIHNSLKHKS